MHFESVDKTMNAYFMLTYAVTYADVCVLKQHAGRALLHFESFDKAMDAYCTIAGAPPSV